MSSLGKQFKKNCDYVHTVADEVIKKRKQTLVCTRSNLVLANFPIASDFDQICIEMHILFNRFCVHNYSVNVKIRQNSCPFHIL